MAIVGNANQAAATLGTLHPDFGRASVNGVLDHFFHNRRRPLNDLTRSNASHKRIGQNLNGHGGNYEL